MNGALWTIIIAELIAIAIAGLYYLAARRENAELRAQLAARREDADNVRARIIANDVSRVATVIAQLGAAIEVNGQRVASLAGVHDRIAHTLERIGRSEVWGDDAPGAVKLCPLCKLAMTDYPPSALMCDACAGINQRTGRAPQ